MTYTRPSSEPLPLRVLCVEDNPDDLELMALALERADPQRRYFLHRVEEAASFAHALEQSFDLVLCDYHLPRFSPQAALQMLRDGGSPLPLVVVTRAIGEEAAVAILRSGARDYVTKDRLTTLPQVIERVLAAQAHEAEKARMAAELETAYQRLQTLSARLVASQERERNLIAHELHDELGQTLAGMMLHLHAARVTPNETQARSHTDTAMGMAQSAIEQLKSMSFALRPAQLDLLGLPSTLETALEKIAEPAGLTWSLSTRGTAPPTPGDNAALALRLVLETAAYAAQ